MVDGRGMYNLFVIIITRFFKWLYYPDIDADERPKPVVVAGLRKAKPKGGKKRKRYGPGDMWGLDDNEVFLKYCPDPRIKGYHALILGDHELRNVWTALENLRGLLPAAGAA